MPKFLEGQEVEVRSDWKPSNAPWLWRPAIIITRTYARGINIAYKVQFPDGTQDTVDSTNIRSIPIPKSHKPNCPTQTPFATLPGVKAYCTCND